MQRVYCTELAWLLWWKFKRKNGKGMHFSTYFILSKTHQLIYKNKKKFTIKNKLRENSPNVLHVYATVVSKLYKYFNIKSVDFKLIFVSISIVFFVHGIWSVVNIFQQINFEWWAILYHCIKLFLVWGKNFSINW